ncbi:MAG: heme ABC exporter ATP-binding protein CcmA [Rhodothermales bacterium]
MLSEPRLSEPRLSVEGLAKRYGRRSLFRGLDFDLGPGDSLAVTGRNGAGKSTLLQIVAGVRTPTAGTVRLWLRGEEVEPEARPLRTGFVAPYLNLYDAFSARENLDFLARARRLADAEARIEAVLDRVGLGGRGDDLVRTYSSGMKQRVRLAAALLAGPSLLLLDEPTANLDAPGRAVVEAVAGAHREAGGILLVATNVDHEAALCERAIEVGGD